MFWKVEIEQICSQLILSEAHFFHVPTGYGFSVGTRIVEINATLSLWKIFYGPATEYWRRSFDISKSRDFYANQYDATLDFTASYGEGHLENDYQNGAYVKMNVIYVEDI